MLDELNDLIKINHEKEWLSTILCITPIVGVVEEDTLQEINVTWEQ